MDYEKSKQIAQAALDNEFEDANHNPVDYCLSMGWAKDSKGTQQAIEKKGKLAPSESDIKKLTKIIFDLEVESTLAVYENNTFHDFLCNCVAAHIIS